MTDTKDGTDTGQRCGFVAVLGAPNAGKSTLINNLVGSKVSIVSPKAQTTRSLVRGITINQKSQIIFVDTPGLFVAQKRLEKAMVAAAWNSSEDADIVMLVYDSQRSRLDKAMLQTVEKLKERGGSAILVLNKTDLIRPPELLALAQEFNDLCDFDATFMVSAKKGRGTDAILDYLAKNLQEGPWLYPEDQISDLPMRLLAAEITREKLFHKLHQELPYGLTVETENWEEEEDRVDIHQVIFIDRESHKPIVLGKGGRMVKMIGTEARQELEEILDKKVNLQIFVKVSGAWQEDPSHYAAWGLEFNS